MNDKTNLSEDGKVPTDLNNDKMPAISEDKSPAEPFEDCSGKLYFELSKDGKGYELWGVLENI